MSEDAETPSKAVIMRELGRLEGMVSALDKRVSDNEINSKAELQEVKQMLAEILALINSGRGAWWMLVKIGTLGTALGTALAFLVKFFKNGSFQ